MGEGAEVELDEDGQEIIARGVWTQAANGDTTYYPGHVRPRRLVGEPYGNWYERAPYMDGGEAEDGGETGPSSGGAASIDPARDDPARDDSSCDSAASDAFWDHPDAPARGDPRGGYRIRSQTVWGQAQADYLAGDSAPAICDRYDLSLGAFRSRAARDGWRRSDHEDPCLDDPRLDDPRLDPSGLDPDGDAGADPQGQPDLDLMAADVLARARRAIARGRAAEAATWLRVHNQLTRLIPAPPPPLPPEPEPELEPRPAPAPDPFRLITLKMKAVGDVARAAAALDPANTQGQAALRRLLDQLGTVGSFSDDSDDSDCEPRDPAEAPSGTPAPVPDD